MLPPQMTVATISIMETVQLNTFSENVFPTPAKRYFSDHIPEAEKMVYPIRYIFSGKWNQMLSTEEVRINTMQVEIKSMMVGKKQLTLSLMRQIIEEPLIDEEQLQFKGIPWGHVNYFWGDDKHKTYPSYINVVWQKGDVLRRNIIVMNLYHHEHSEKRCLREIQECLGKIKYYTQYTGFDNKLATQKTLLASLQDDLRELEYRRDVFIPKYHELVEPLKSLDHFYITV